MQKRFFSLKNKRQHTIGITRLHSSRMRTARWLPVSQHTLHRGVSVRQVSAKGGCLPRGMVVCVCGSPPPWTEWQTGVKTSPCRNFFAGGKYEAFITQVQKRWIKKQWTISTSANCQWIDNCAMNCSPYGTNANKISSIWDLLPWVSVNNEIIQGNLSGRIFILCSLQFGFLRLNCAA